MHTFISKVFQTKYDVMFNCMHIFHRQLLGLNLSNFEKQCFLTWVWPSLKTDMHPDCLHLSFHHLSFCLFHQFLPFDYTNSFSITAPPASISFSSNGHGSMVPPWLPAPQRINATNLHIWAYINRDISTHVHNPKRGLSTQWNAFLKGNPWRNT